MNLRHKQTLAVAATLALNIIPIDARAQAEPNDAENPTSGYELGVHAGPLLPSRIRRVREIVSGWGIRGNIPTEKGNFELDTFIGRSNGISYNTVALNFRLDVPNAYVPTHVLIGGHADYYMPRGLPYALTTGWHFGGGTTQRLGGPVFFRADFQYRFGPGNSLYVGLGVLYRFSEGNAGR